MGQKNQQSAKAKTYDFDSIKNVIENGFMHDCAISIEYAVNASPDHTKWIRWQKTLYAIKDSDQVLEEIKACCKNNPDCSMKLVCEHFRPQYRLIYCIERRDNDPPNLKLAADPE